MFLLLTGSTFQTPHIVTLMTFSLIYLTLDHNLTQLIMSPNQLQYILDLCLTNKPSEISNINVLPDISDHDVIQSTVDIIPKQVWRKIYLYSKAPWDTIKEAISDLVSDVLSSMNCDNADLWNQLKSCILYLVDEYKHT